MDPKDRALLRHNRVYLVSNLDPDTIDNALVAEDLMTEDQDEEMRSKATRKRKVEYLLDKISLKGPTAMKRFIKVLQENSSQSYIADHLLDKEKEQGRGVPLPPPIPVQEVDEEEEEESDAGRRRKTGDDAYQMKSRPRGHAIIINNKNFTGGRMKVRTGTNRDANGLNDLFQWLQFEVTRHDDLTVARIRDVTSELARMDHSAYDCFILAILSHGENGEIYGTDEKLISIEDIISQFETNQSLIGKPKLFFLQACRGGQLDRGVTETDGIIDDVDLAGPIEIVLGEDEVDARLSSLPTQADFLLSYATTPGFVSWRNQSKGSWYVHSLVDVFYKYAKDEHLLELLTRVNNEVATQFESSTGKKKQIPSPVFMLRKKLYFRPGK
ncbi:caspase-3-like [Oscarella lobularis]|uniref:caspase-3-like n=1 Tax=Oscarella lobularis TaxID=121494 RepID=UPI0033139871